MGAKAGLQINGLDLAETLAAAQDAGVVDQQIEGMAVGQQRQLPGQGGVLLGWSYPEEPHAADPLFAARRFKALALPG